MRRMNTLKKNEELKDEHERKGRSAIHFLLMGIDIILIMILILNHHCYDNENSNGPAINDGTENDGMIMVVFDIFFRQSSVILITHTPSS